jgi:molybdopterin-guanine dinucleotide biosynthesis protein A
MPSRPVLAIFVGGQSKRMGKDKGLLTTPGGDETIVEALVQHGRDAGLDPVLVGEALPYAHLVPEILRIDDEPPGAGPLAGLHAALRHTLCVGAPSMIAVACDMPYVSVDALVAVRDHRGAGAVLAPRRSVDGPWEPMLARYDAARLADFVEAAISRGQLSFQAIFAEVEVEPMPLSPSIEQALRDWDRPEDLPPVS